MITSQLLTVFFAAFIAQAYTFKINCGKNHKAYVWNCQTLLDNWHLNDNTFYAPQNYPCVWRGSTKYGTPGTQACKLLENDSCTLVVSYWAQGNGYTGAELKSFVQQSINQCTSNNQVSTSISGSEEFTKGDLCLCNHDNANACI